MAAGKVSRILRGPVKIVVGPTDLSDADPYGGTEVGLSNQVALTPLGETVRIENEGLGEATDILHPNNRWLLTCFMRGADDKARELFFLGNYSNGQTTQHGVFSAPGLKNPGESMLAESSRVILLVPENLIDMDALIIYRGIPMWSDDAEIAFQKKEEFGIPLAIDCLRDSNNNILRLGRLADLSLT